MRAAWSARRLGDRAAGPCGIRYDDAQTIAFPWKVNPSEWPNVLSQLSVSPATEPMT
jgi:hypothetical protein